MLTKGQLRFTAEDRHAGYRYLANAAPEISELAGFGNVEEEIAKRI